MSVNKRAGVFAHGRTVVTTAIVLGVIASIIWAIAYGAMTWWRGIYAGFHYNDAKAYATQVLVDKYGMNLTHEMRLGQPDVVNTHLPGPLGTTAGQVRIFHFVGPRGVHYCVSVWAHTAQPHHNDIQKGCKF